MIQKPYLIQLGKLREKFNKRSTFDETVELFYMGRAEFEWGAIPDSLARLTKNTEHLVMLVYKEIRDYKNRKLVVVGYNTDIYDYFDYIEKMISEDPKHCEPIRLKENISGMVTRVLEKERPISECPTYMVDMWWDLENDVIFCFSVDRAKTIIRAIRNTENKKLNTVLD